jgi:hypothetical protein
MTFVPSVWGGSLVSAGGRRRKSRRGRALTSRTFGNLIRAATRSGSRKRRRTRRTRSHGGFRASNYGGSRKRRRTRRARSHGGYGMSRYGVRKPRRGKGIISTVASLFGLGKRRRTRRRRTHGGYTTGNRFNALYGSGRRRTRRRTRRTMSAGGRRRTRRGTRRGRGFFGDLWDKVKSVGSTVASHALPVLKDLGVGLLKKKLGLGRRRTRRGRGISDVLYRSTRGRRPVSRFLTRKGWHRSASLAHTLGLGRRRSRRGRGNILQDLWSKAHYHTNGSRPVSNFLRRHGWHKTGNFVHSLGFGKRRRTRRRHGRGIVSSLAGLFGLGRKRRRSRRRHGRGPISSIASLFGLGKRRRRRSRRYGGAKKLYMYGGRF